MRLSQKQQGNIIIFSAMLLFGLNIPITKYLYNLENITPLAVTLLRMAFAAFAFWILSLFFQKEKVNSKDLLVLFVGGIMGMGVNQTCFAIGLRLTSPVDAAIIATIAPLFTMILAALFLKEPVTWLKTLGIVVAGIGAVVLVLSNHNFTGGNSSLSGNMLVALAQLFYSTYIVITRPLSMRYSFVTMMKWMFLSAFIIVFPFGISDVIHAPLFNLASYPEFISTSKYAFYALGFILFGSTFITYALIPLAQKRIRPTTISVYNNVQPVVATAVAISVGMDDFSIIKILSAIIIAIGVLFVTQSKSGPEDAVEKG